MLKGISPLLSPELLKVLAEMGHGDEIVLADGNFPSEHVGEKCHVIRADGHGVPELLEAILDLIPLDQYVSMPAALMAVGENESQPPIWETYRSILTSKGESGDNVEQMERYAFYERARNAYAIIATGETAIYANILLKKGVISC